ncbi:MAG: M56 family metallopeptidase [Pseudomonadota bacterium]
MSDTFALLLPAIFGAVIHSLWVGAGAAVCYVTVGAWIRSAQAKYVLAFVALLVTPVTFVTTLVSALGAAPLPVGSASHTNTTSLSLVTCVAVAWILGASFASVRLTFGWLWFRQRIVAKATLPPLQLARLFAKTKWSLGTSSRVMLRLSDVVSGPMATGVLRPVVLIPVSMTTGMDPALVRTAFVHELSHLRRLDHIAVVAQAWTEALMFFHPAVWWLSREVHRTREYRCDEDAIAVLQDKVSYARALMTLEQLRVSATTPTLMMNGGDLMDRISRLLGVATPKPRTAYRGTAAVAVISLMISLVSQSYGNMERQTDPADSQAHAELSIEWLPPAITQWRDDIEAAAQRHEVPADFLALMVFAESGGNDTAQSRLGARGLLQVMPKTGEAIAAHRGIAEFTVDRLFEPATNLDFGAWYLSQQLTRFATHGEQALPLALSAYNAGPGAVAAHINEGQPLPDETVRYRDAVMAMWRDRAEDNSTTLEKRLQSIRSQIRALVTPTPGRVTSGFGKSNQAAKHHNGVDIATAQGEPVMSALDGTVLATGSDKKRGNYVVLRHGSGVETHYFHLATVAVAVEQAVSAGQQLGSVGASGAATKPHLHFEIREYGEPVAPELYGFKVDANTDMQ